MRTIKKLMTKCKALWYNKVIDWSLMKATSFRDDFDRFDYWMRMHVEYQIRYLDLLLA